ncbi:MAG: ADP-ribosylation factor family protein [Candidatus Asgardarchaeia archaeon]
MSEAYIRMGLAKLAQLYTKLALKKITIIGLNNAGKTTLVQRLRLNQFVKTKMTQGLTIESIEYKNFKFIVYDLGGQESFRKYLWKHFLKSDLIVFVVDSTDVERLEIAANELRSVLLNAKVPILVLANKQDLPNALSAGEIIKAMRLYEFKDRSFAVFPVSALTGENVFEAFDWAVDKLSKK